MNARSHLRVTLLPALLLATLLAGSVPAQGAAPAPQSGGRVVSLTANPNSDQPTEQQVRAAYNLAYQAGARGGLVVVAWSALEPYPGYFNFAHLLTGIQALSEAGATDIMVSIPAIDITVKSTPIDLRSAPFNSLRMRLRYRRLIRAVLPHLNARVKYISFGNEVDAYLSSHPREWATFQTFYEDAVSYLHSLAPGIKAGVSSRFYESVGIFASDVARLNTESDVIILTYYPTTGNNAASEDLPRMVALGGGRPAILQEVGYPTESGFGINSSEEEQMLFIRNFFAAWRTVGSSIPFANYFLMHDFTQQTCDALVSYYGIDPNFLNIKGFLCSLGLRKSNGDPKLGWAEFVTGAQAMLGP